MYDDRPPSQQIDCAPLNIHKVPGATAVTVVESVSLLVSASMPRKTLCWKLVENAFVKVQFSIVTRESLHRNGL